MQRSRALQLALGVWIEEAEIARGGTSPTPALLVANRAEDGTNHDLGNSDALDEDEGAS